ncbi:hypothetical protein AMECASPLE_011264 [Ameca splendens]|uniref:Uncharacterized protein n=1 Tax=Ameca splendens TaxID=208324 RepID=A0ABV0YBM3_9TELE
MLFTKRERTKTHRPDDCLLAPLLLPCTSPVQNSPTNTHTTLHSSCLIHGSFILQKVEGLMMKAGIQSWTMLSYLHYIPPNSVAAHFDSLCWGDKLPLALG